MIQKIQILQKRLISKTEEVVEKELMIQEKEKLYVELKHILARQPGPEVAEQLQIYQQTLKEKTKQMKVIHLYEDKVRANTQCRRCSEPNCMMFYIQNIVDVVGVEHVRITGQ